MASPPLSRSPASSTRSSPPPEGRPEPRHTNAANQIENGAQSAIPWASRAAERNAGLHRRTSRLKAFAQYPSGCLADSTSLAPTLSHLFPVDSGIPTRQASLSVLDPCRRGLRHPEYTAPAPGAGVPSGGLKSQVSHLAQHSRLPADHLRSCTRYYLRAHVTLTCPNFRSGQPDRSSGRRSVLACAGAEKHVGDPEEPAPLIKTAHPPGTGPLASELPVTADDQYVYRSLLVAGVVPAAVVTEIWT